MVVLRHLVASFTITKNVVLKMTLLELKRLPNDVQEEIGKLQQQGTSESIICKEIFTSLIEDDNFKSISSCLKIFECIPEDVLVKILIYFLNKTRENSKDVTEAFESEIFSQINLILDTGFTDIFLQEHLRHISVKNTKVLFKYLVHCLDNVPCLQPGKYLPLNKISDWLCVLLDAQYHTIILSSDKEFSTILERLNESLKSKFIYLEELEKLEAILVSFKLKTSSKTSDQNLPYSIEKLSII